MRRNSLLRRIAGSVYLALAITLSGVLPAAHARAEAASAAATSHVEALDGDGSCPQVHDHWNCNTCRALRLMARGEPAARIEVVVCVVAGSAADVAGHVQFAPGAVARPRAPPQRFAL